jgi:hypothetical protein
MLKRILLVVCGWLLLQLNGRAANQVSVDLTIRPATHSFTCRYTLTAPGPAAQARLTLHLSPWLHAVNRVFDSFQKDTLQQLTADFTRPQNLPPRFFTADSLLEFTPYASWLPNLPDREYEPVDYRLTVRVPAGYQVVSTHAPRRSRAGRYEFAGTAPNIEITALAAPAFTRLETAGPAPRVVLYKANRPATRLDTLLLTEAQRIIRYQNRIIGGADSIRGFTFLLPGTNRNAGGLLDNAAVITYAAFDVRDPGDRLILAHEISHKWWGYGTWNDYNNWLNEGFATYSGLLYLQAAGDTVSFRQGLAQRRARAAGAPPVIGFDVRRNSYAMFRRVLYDKATVILHELRQRLGDAAFFRLLTATAAARVVTTDAFLELVEKQTDRPTRLWLTQQLST